MQYVIHQRGFYIVEMNSAGITKKSENKAEAKRFSEKEARMLATYFFNAEVEPAVDHHN